MCLRAGGGRAQLHSGLVRSLLDPVNSSSVSYFIPLDWQHVNIIIVSSLVTIFFSLQKNSASGNETQFQFQESLPWDWKTGWLGTNIISRQNRGERPAPASLASPRSATHSVSFTHSEALVTGAHLSRAWHLASIEAQGNQTAAPGVTGDSFRAGSPSRSMRVNGCAEAVRHFVPRQAGPF